jgi:RNA polymerase sigma factor (sigma-70 family)
VSYRGYRNPQAFPAWLYRIAARASIDAARKDQRLPATTELPEQRLSIADGDPEVTALRREKVRLTWEAMATMPARQHVALYLREIQNMSYKEIAQMLGTSQSVVEMLLFRARQGFTKAYERLESAGPDRCQNARRSMSAVLDGEGTRVQQNAIRAHADACLPCSGELAQMRRASAAFSALLPLPVPALLSQRILESVGATGAGAAVGSGAAVAPAPIAKVVALATAKAKIAGVTLVATVVTTAATVGAMNSPLADEIRPGPAAVQQPSQPVEFSALPLAEVEISDNPRASNSETSQAPLSNEQQLAPPLIDPNLVPSTIGTIDDLTAPLSSTLNQTTSDPGQTVTQSFTRSRL